MRRRHGSTGFTLIELLAVMAIVGVLFAVLLPAIQNVRAKGNEAECASNQRQIVNGYLLYSQEHGGRFPEFSATGGGDKINWRQSLYPYVAEPNTQDEYYSIWLCPSKSISPDEWRNTASYGSNLNLSGRMATQIQEPAKIMAVVDTTLSQGHHAKSHNSGRSSVERWVHFRHEGRANMAMLDGHVVSVGPEDLEDRIMPAFNP